MNIPNKKEQFIHQFSNKILGLRNYRSSKKEFATDDFVNLEVLESFLEEVFNGESDLTPAGKSFLEKYFGFDELADLLVKRGKFSISHQCSQQAEISSWLKKTIPMEIMRFIEKSRGNITDDTTLRHDLLPPEIH